MALIQHCLYCPKRVVNSAWHPECRSAHFEDLLLRVQEEILAAGNLPVGLSKHLCEEIKREGKLDSFRDFLAKKEENEKRRVEAARWAAQQAAAAQLAAQEWEKNNPNPWPQVF